MNFLRCVEDFEELRTAARKIDDGINYLEKKLSNVANLGLSVNPEKTKLDAENVLKEYEDEINEIKNNVDSCLLLQENVLQDCIDDNERVSSFICNIQMELSEIEQQLQTKGNYQAYETINVINNSQDSNADSIDNKNDDVGNIQVYCNKSENLNHSTATPGSWNSRSTVFSKSINTVVNSLNTTVDQMISPFSSRFFKTNQEYSTFCENDTSKSNNDVCNQSIAFLEKKLNQIDDIIKTPVDPGVSVISMQLLGKSNIKTDRKSVV